MATLLSTVFYTVVCLASVATTLQVRPGILTIIEKPTRRELLGAQTRMKREVVGPVYARMRRPEVFSDNSLTILKSRQTDIFSSFIDNNISHATKLSPSQVRSLNLNKNEDKNETKNKWSVPILGLTDDKSETSIPSKVTSTRSPFGSTIYTLNRFPDTFNTSRERTRQLLDNQTQKIASPLRHARELSDTDPQSHETWLDGDFTSVSRDPVTGRNHNKLTFKDIGGYTEDRCTCKNNTCDCTQRGLTKIPQNLSTTITELLLGSNNIVMVPKNVLSRYQMLESLVLSYSSIATLEDGAFNGLTRLVYLDLRGNHFQNAGPLPERIFEPLKSLKIILLNSNLLYCSKKRSLFQCTFAYLPSVEELQIDYNGGDDFGPEYKNMTSLRIITVYCGKCKIMSFSNETFQHLDHITELNINDCGINGSTIASRTFLPLRGLLTLDISHNPDIGMNYLYVILGNLRDSNLQTLKMSYIVSEYAITKINQSLTQLLPRKLTTLIAVANNILSFDIDAVRNLPKSLKSIDISGNNIIVNPIDIPLDELEGLETIFIQSNDNECLSNYKENSVQSLCDSLDFQEYKGSREVELAENDISAEIVKNKIVLPGRLKSVTINVQNSHYDFLEHIDLRNNVEAIDLSCSYLPKFSLYFLKHFQKLRCLNMRKTSVRWFDSTYKRWASLKVLILESNMLNYYLSVQGAPFMDLINLAYLDLSLNQLTYLRRDLFMGLNKLEYIRLDRNSFTVFGADLSHMAQLKLLNLSNTELPKLPSDVRAHIDQLCKVKPGQVRVYMSGCPIQCDCFNLDFLKWMVRSAAFDKNFTGYNCRYSDTSLRYIQDGYQETIAVLDRECAKNYPMFLVVLAATLVLLCSVVGAVVYRLRWKIRYLYYAAYLKIMDKRKNDNQHEFAYDAFISYDSEDQGFVTRLLAPELEKRGLKLLVHTRDFVAGTYIASNIVMAVAESRKTLVLLTRNLLESSWCNYELQMATMEAVHTGRQVLVFLLKEDIPSRELEVDLLRHIRSNTYLPYPGPEEEGDDDVMGRFYDKLAHDLRC